MQVGVLEQLQRYPIKSMGGERLDEVELGAGGLPGDRAWAVRDEVRGGIRGAKKLAGLLELSARYPNAPAATGSSPAEITLPDGSILGTGERERLTEGYYNLNLTERLGLSFHAIVRRVRRHRDGRYDSGFRKSTWVRLPIQTLIAFSKAR